MVAYIVGSITSAIIFLYGCIGEIITEKSGQLNLGIPGVMCLGGAGGCLGASICFSIVGGTPSWILLLLFSLLFSLIFSVFGSSIYAFLTVTLRANQNITGLALTTFGAGVASFIVKQLSNVNEEIVNKILPQAGSIIRSSLSFAKDLGWFGEIFLGYGILVYLGIAIAIISSILLKKSRVGLHLRSVGENPATADAVGINVTKYKYLAIIIGGGIAGIGGMYALLDFCMGKGVLENISVVQGYGWLAIALVIFAVWKPSIAIGGSILFGLLARLAYIGLPLDVEILRMVPYVITVIVLIITSIFGSKSVQPPSSLGINYFREER